ncbi:MAG: ATP-dependent DNA helicase [Lachnospiraceae bacterium]|nr:ATP-dependent DNA helicase [Lachnospiraceae bacterium]
MKNPSDHGDQEEEGCSLTITAGRAGNNDIDDGLDIPEDLYLIRLSVRELVEFVLRSGDIDNRRTVSPEKAMQEGAKLHRKIQRSMGAGYSAEVSLNYTHVTERYAIRLDGRADGIIDERIAEIPELMSNQLSFDSFIAGGETAYITIDEIKCVNRSLRGIRKPEEVHLAQAKVYAYIYALKNRLPIIRVRMTYCSIKNGDMKYFFEEYSFSSLREWFDSLMASYMKWADREWEWRQLRQASIKQLDFPFEYRKGQKELASEVYRTIRDGRKLFLEAPTGVGKTVSTLFPAVKAMGEGLTERIFYLTARTITRGVASDTIELMRGKGLKLKSITIIARDKICPLEKAECNPEACPYARGHYDRVNDAIFDTICKKDHIGRNELTEASEAYKVCPFELSLDLSLFADAIICDYNYVFDPHVCLKRYFAEGNRGDHVFLVDEAHNLVDRGREMYSAEICKEDFLRLKRKLNDELTEITLKESRQRRKNRLMPLLMKVIRELERCNLELLIFRKRCEKYRIEEDVDRLAGLIQGLYTSLNELLEEEDGVKSRDEVLEFFFLISHFLLIYERLDVNYKIYTECREDGEFCLKLFCINPRENLIECMSKGRSTVLFSATLLPIKYFKEILGGKDGDNAIYAESSFNKDKLNLLIGRDLSSRFRQRSRETYLRYAQYIKEIVSEKCGNYMIFFPSYAFMSEVYELFITLFHNQEAMECLIQKENMSEEEREIFLARFSRTSLAMYDKDVENSVDKVLIGFCVLGGVFSEGIDLKEDALIGSVIAGFGLPGVCCEREIIKEFFGSEGYDYAYRIPGMNKVLQAAGRVIRTEKDRGIVALLDDRFLERSSMRMFPREWAGYTVTDIRGIADELAEFWDEI